MSSEHLNPVVIEKKVPAFDKWWHGEYHSFTIKEIFYAGFTYGWNSREKHDAETRNHIREIECEYWRMCEMFCLHHNTSDTNKRFVVEAGKARFVLQDILVNGELKPAVVLYKPCTIYDVQNKVTVICDKVNLSDHHVAFYPK